ncbi:restriction endonuclease subunit S [Neomicrococcus lactis]
MSLSYGRIIRKDIAANDGLLPASFDTYQVINRNDIVLRLTDLQNDKRSLRSAISPERGIITSAYLAVTPTNILPHYLSYLLRAYDLQKVFYAMGGGLRQSMKFSDMKWLPILLPPESTQQEIIAYLDRETAQIDELIGKQERLIELLAEKRQAIITHAVTKGLNPNASTKPSGISWTGHVPESWQTTELKRALNFITSGSRGWAEFYADFGTPFIRIGNLTRGHIHLNMSETQHVEIPPDAEGTRAVIEAGDVLFSITAYLGSVAVASDKDSGSYVSQHVAITRLKQDLLNSRFLAYFVLSEFGQRQLNEGAYGGTKLQLSLEDIKKLIIPIPGLSEQREIVQHLDTSVGRIDAVIEVARQFVTLLRERSSALVSAAVTGKIDVRKEAASA